MKLIRPILACSLICLFAHLGAGARNYTNTTKDTIKLAQVSLDRAHDSYLEGIERADYFMSSDGCALRYAFFRAPQNALTQNPLTVLILHGRATFIEYYEPLIEKFLKMGVDVWTYDLEGQGLSTRLLENNRKGHIDSFDTYLQHLDEFINIAIKPILGGKNLMLAGYSLGGHIALRYLEQHPGKTSGAFLMSPMIAINVDIVSALAVHLLYYIGFHESFVLDADETVELLKSQFESNPYTSNKFQYTKLRDIMTHYKDHSIGGVTFGWAKQAFDSCNELFAQMDKIKDPVHIVCGSKDTTVDIHASEEFARQCDSCAHRILEGAHHEIFRETTETRVKLWKDLEAFVKEQITKAMTPG